MVRFPLSCSFSGLYIHLLQDFHLFPRQFIVGNAVLRCVRLGWVAVKKYIAALGSAYLLTYFVLCQGARCFISEVNL